jgi:hypothetical protein
MISRAALAILAFAAQNLDRTSTAPHQIPESDMHASSSPRTQTSTHPFVGMWVTKDGHIRQELLPNGRYDEARGKKKSAYTGSYTINGNHIDYVDDTGFTADGEFRHGVLYHAGYVFYRQ